MRHAAEVIERAQEAGTAIKARPTVPDRRNEQQADVCNGSRSTARSRSDHASGGDFSEQSEGAA
jgi:hypothetical protein